MEREREMMRRGEGVVGMNEGKVEWAEAVEESAAVDMWIGLPRAGWAEGAEKWDWEQGRVPGPEEGFAEERAVRRLEDEGAR